MEYEYFEVRFLPQEQKSKNQVHGILTFFFLHVLPYYEQEEKSSQKKVRNRKTLACFNLLH